MLLGNYCQYYLDQSVPGALMMLQKYLHQILDIEIFISTYLLFFYSNEFCTEYSDKNLKMLFLSRQPGNSNS